MRLVRLLLLPVAIFAGVASAQTIDQCKQIKGAAKRVECFDKATATPKKPDKKMTAAEKEPLPAETNTPKHKLIQNSIVCNTTQAFDVMKMEPFSNSKGSAIFGDITDIKPLYEINVKYEQTIINTSMKMLQIPNLDMRSFDRESKQLEKSQAKLSEAQGNLRKANQFLRECSIADGENNYVEIIGTDSIAGLTHVRLTINGNPENKWVAQRDIILN